MQKKDLNLGNDIYADFRLKCQKAVLDCSKYRRHIPFNQCAREDVQNNGEEGEGFNPFFLLNNLLNVSELAELQT